jgi:hypothetical protein
LEVQQFNYPHSAHTPSHSVSFTIAHRSAAFTGCPDGSRTHVMMLPCSGLMGLGEGVWKTMEEKSLQSRT